MAASCLSMNSGIGGSGGASGGRRGGSSSGGSSGSGGSGGSGSGATCTGGTATSLECFRAIVNKCNGELEYTGNMINTIRQKRRFPHTGFYQKNWSAVNQVNCRTIDLIRSVQNMNGTLRPDSMLDIYQANLRFQLAVQNLVLTRAMLSTSLDEFITRVADYEALIRSSAIPVAAASPVATYADDDNLVSSTTTDDELSSSSREAALSAKLGEIQSNITVIQSFLNQSPMLSNPIRMELHLMEIYDDFDDSVAVHRLLTDPNALSLLPNDRQSIYHDWNYIASEEVVKNKFVEVTQNFRNNARRGGGGGGGGGNAGGDGTMLGAR